MVKNFLLKIFKVITGAGLWLFIGAIAIYALTGAYYSNFISDGDVMYATTVAIVKEHTVELKPNPGQPQIVPGSNGHYYSKYGLGQSLAAIPFFKFGLANAFTYGLDYNALDVMPFFFVRFLPIFATAATVWLVYVWAAQLYASRKVGIGLAVLYGLGTSAWPYSRYFFSEPLFTFCTFGAAFCLYSASNAGKVLSRRSWLVAGGFLLGYALLVRVSGVVLLPAYGVYLWLTQKPNIRLEKPYFKTIFNWQNLKPFVFDSIAATLGALPVLALLLWYNYVRFGNILNNGYDGEGFTTPIWEGFYGLLFSPGKSVFLYSPVLIGVIFSIKGFWQRFKPEAVLGGLIIGITILYYSLWWAWWGGSCWGPRFLVPVLPFAIMGLGILLQKSRKWVGGIWVILFPVSVLVQMIGVAPDFNVYINSITHGDPALDHIYIFDLDKSPLIAQLKMLRHPDTYTIRSLTLHQVGLNVDTAQNFSPTLIILGIIATLVICYNYFISNKQLVQKNQLKVGSIKQLAASQ